MAGKQVELVRGGEDKAVTEGNKAEYLELMKNWLARKRYSLLPTFIHSFIHSFIHWGN